MLDKIPMGRMGTVEEVAAMVGWMCSEQCSYTTGAVFDLSEMRRATYATIENYQTFHLCGPAALAVSEGRDRRRSGRLLPVLEGHAETLAAHVDELSDFLIGRNPLRVEDTWQAIYRNGCYRGGPVLMSAISGIDMALWNLKGKYHNAPVTPCSAARCATRCAAIAGSTATAGGAHGRLPALRAAGYDACKMNICEELQIVDRASKIDAIVSQLFELREKRSCSMDLAFDFHGRVWDGTARLGRCC